MNCRDFREIIDSYLSDELLTETNHGILRHLEDCPECRDEIEARRAVRNRLRSAIRNESQYLIDEKFTGDLSANLRSSLTKPRLKRSFYSKNRSWMAVAASLLVVVSIGFVFLGQSGDVPMRDVVEKSISIPNLPAAHIVNIALGDHEYCAVQHGSSVDHPISLVKEAEEYRGMEKVVIPSIKTVLADYELTESHYCKYKGVKFAHLVLKKEEKAVSVLVASLSGFDRQKKDGIQSLSAKRYQIARFDTQKRAVFVVSNLNEQQNFKALEALFEPIQKHFSKEDGGKLNTTVLTSF